MEGIPKRELLGSPRDPSMDVPFGLGGCGLTPQSAGCGPGGRRTTRTWTLGGRELLNKALPPSAKHPQLPNNTDSPNR